MSALDLWESAAVAIAIGLLVGAERERSTPHSPTAGVRTFALVALLGNLVTLLPIAAAAVLLAAVAVLVAATYLASRDHDPGLTSEVALLVTAALGVLTHTRPALAVGAAVAMVVLLVSKEVLHQFVRHTVTQVELVDALKFFVAAFVVLPLLPKGSFGPYHVWSPHRIWLLVVLVTGIGWVGYAATRALGARRGLLVAGLAGGFVSGTATIGAMGQRSRQGAPRDATLAGALMASVATLLEVVVLTTITDVDVGLHLYAALAIGVVLLAAEAWWLNRASAGTTPAADPGRPFALLPALVIAAVISGVLLLAAWMDDQYGASGATLATAIGSLADVHASAVAVSNLVHTGRIVTSVAVEAIGIGLLVNTVSKVVVASTTGGTDFGLRVLLWHLAPAAGVAAGILAAI